MIKPNHRVLRRSVTTALLAFGLSTGAAANALDMNDILNLQAAGLDANTMVTVIRSSTEPLTVTADQVEQLRAAGVAAPVLDEICLRVGCGAGPAGPTGPAPGMNGGPVGPDLQREIERQRLQEEERRRLEMERMEQERQRMRNAIEAEQARETQVNDAFQGLTIAERYYRQGDYNRAASVYREFLDEVAPAAGTVQYNDALTGFVRSMYGAGFRYSIRVEALEATLLGPTSDRFPEMFEILVDISNEASFLDPQFERLTGLQVGTFDQEFQDEWNYFLGRFFWVYGEYSRSMQFLSRIADGSDRAAQANYITGVMALEQGENSRALTTFQAAADQAEVMRDGQDVYELANLAIARIAYEAGLVDVALYYYNKIPFGSARHPRAVFEMAWTYTLKQAWNRAIGTLHSLHSPYYEGWFFPELYVLEAFAYKETCNLDAAQSAVLAFSEEVATLQAPVRSFIADAGSPDEYWNAISTYYDVYDTPNAIPLPIEAVRWVLSDVDFVNQMQLITSLEEERSRLGSQGDALGEFGPLALAGINADISTRTLEAGLQIQSMLSDFESELTDWYVKSQEVSIEVRTEYVTAVDLALEGVEIGNSSASSVFVLASDWQYWPYEGEYWVDEVDAYRGDLASLRDPDSGQCLSIDLDGDSAVNE